MAELAYNATVKKSRVLFFSHRKEINEQVIKTFEAAGCDMDYIDIYGVQSLVRKLDKVEEPQLILIDEAHHSKAKSYLKIIEYFKKSYKLLFTGTPIRLDNSGFDDIAEDIVLGKSVRWLQENGNIAPFKYYAPKLIDTSLLKKRAGEFTRQSTDETMKRVIYGDVIKHYEKLAKGKQAIVYAHSVEAAEVVSKAFQSSGYQSAVVHGKTSQERREELMCDFREGRLPVLVNVELFTEGIDLPNVDVCIMLRPTQSLSLYLQFAMRPLNPRDGKTAIIIDHVGNVERFGLPNHDREWSLKGIKSKKTSSKNEPATRVCEECFSVFWSKERICPTCGHENQLTQAEIEEIKEAELEEVQQELEERVSTYLSPDACSNMRELIEYANQHGYKKGWAYFQAKRLRILR